MSDAENLRRWRLILGDAAADGASAVRLSGDDAGMDQALAALYDAKEDDGSSKRGGLGASAPNVTRWLGDIRKYFPSSVVRVMQTDAMERLHLKRMLLEPELLDAMTPDISLAATLVSLSGVIPAKTRETARRVVQTVVDDLQRKLANPLRQAIQGSLNRSQRNRRPRMNEMDWNRTIRANLKNYLPEYKTVIAETRIGFGRKRNALRDVTLCIDQSGSMARSVVYASVCGAVMASLPALHTRLVVFDTAVVDLSDKLQDPVDLLFGVQLGGGTDIAGALAYCQSTIRNPGDTILVLISDLYEGGLTEKLLQRAAALVASGVQLIVLLALSDEGAPSYDHTHAALLARLGIPAFACTPDQFPDLMAAAIKREDIGAWAAARGIS